MRFRTMAALLAFLMGLCSSHAGANESEQFAAEQQAALAKLLPEFGVATLSLIVAFGSSQCGASPARAKYEASLAEMASFRNQKVHIANVRLGDPVTTFKSDISRNAINLIDETFAHMQAQLADSALRFGCYEAANAFYRQVINYTGKGSEVLVRRAQIGIEDVREKLRTQPSK